MTQARLDPGELYALLSLYPLARIDNLIDVAGPEDGGQTYRVTSGGRRYLLRVSPKRQRFDELVFERDVMLRLRSVGLAVPEIVQNVATGSFTPWNARKRYAWLFHDVQGRPPGVFEVEPSHTRAIGDFLGRMHVACSALEGGPTQPFEGWPDMPDMQKMKRACATGRLGERPAKDAEILLSSALALSASTPQPKRPTRIGVIHGGLELRATRFVNGTLTGVVHFEHARRAPFTIDLARAIHEWCWAISPKNDQGPHGVYDVRRVQGLLSAYDRVRTLDKNERQALRHDLVFLGLARAIRDFQDFEIEPRRRIRAFQDYRHYLARLVALDELESHLGL